MKHINKIKLRKLKIINDTYLWKRGHYHLSEFEYSKCAEKIVIYLEGYKNSPLHLLIREEDNLKFMPDVEKEKWNVGYPEAGVIWLSKQEKEDKQQEEYICIDFNRSAVIRKIIDYFLLNNWKPKESKTAFIIEDALLLINKINLPKGME